MGLEIAGWLLAYGCAGYFACSIMSFLALEPERRSLRAFLSVADAFRPEVGDSLFERVLRVSVFVAFILCWPALVAGMLYYAFLDRL